MKRLILFITAVVILFVGTTVYAKDMETLTGKSLLLASMDGKILYEKNIDEKLPIASITKITTALLVMEAVDDGKITLDDMVTVSETAAIKTGSRIFLSVGEQISVRDLMKGLMVASGNDAAITLAEYLCGSQDAFVNEMNKRAKQLGMENTNYENCHGLDSDNHYSTARDIMTVTAELMKHPGIFDYSTIWMDTLRNGEFQLSNTNKLIRFYEGATGMKTGSTTKAKNCLCATAERGGMHLIAIVLQAPTSQDRFGDASTMLNYGFNTFEKVKVCEKNAVHSYLDIEKGEANSVGLLFNDDFSTIVKKGESSNISYEIKKVPQKLKAPIEKGEKIGVAEIYNGDEKIGEVDMVARDSVNKITIWYIFRRLFQLFADFVL